MTRDEKIMRIAQEYSYEAQSRQCIEEMAELTQAINKLWRKSRKSLPDKRPEIVLARGSVIEELADVQIMVWQMSFFLDAGDEIMVAIDKKLDRQLERIGVEQA